MKIVAYGGGTNSTAMIIGLVKKQLIPDLILFSDTAGERPDTYNFIEMFSDWLEANGAPRVQKCHYITKDGVRLTLENDCLNRHTLPPIAFGFKSCSEKYKTRVIEKYCNSHPRCLEIWASGEKVDKYIGYDAGETKRIECHRIYDAKDKKYRVHYPLYEWEWNRDRCVHEIQSVGLPKPGKSSCFFCPSMKKAEIEALWKKYPDLFARAIEMEKNATPNLDKIKGLGRNWSWSEYYNAIQSQPEQLSMFDFDEEPIRCGCSIPCGCFD